MPHRGSLEKCPAPRCLTQPHTGPACSWLPLLMVRANTFTPKPGKDYFTPAVNNEVLCLAAGTAFAVLCVI